MAERGRGGRVGRTAAGYRSPAAALLVVVAVLAGLAGCGAPVRADAVLADAQRVLDRRAAAVLARDTTGYRATLDPGPRGGTPPADPLYDRLARVPLHSWSYTVKDADRSGDRATVRAELGYRIAGYDRAPVVADRSVELRERDGRWYVAGDRPARDAPRQLWEQGPVDTVRGTHSLILGVGHDRARLKEFAGLADRAVPQVSGVWGNGWARRVVVLVPRSLEAMAELLGAPASGYRGIAAVTTGETGGSGPTPADRIIVNPDAYEALGDFGAQVVLTHEATHVATRRQTSEATPLWLSEGYADWVGYHGTGRTARQAAPELERAVRDGRVPGRLPEDADFGFSGDADRLARAYESGWLACRMIEERWGGAELTAFYRAVGAHGQRSGAVDTALRDVLGLSEDDFTARWRTYLTRELG
ncbi:hypothetical protein [Streptomyces sp. AmelKG-E11A]|uniref:hypothetical protein n=1 Tax=Streptomyces sp. AmelKG-E11A TaxID=1100822 RepID=UPI000823E7E1|nr:Peptidase MA superfamily [Streptomyces sp. AmelKG-E11A]